MIVSFGISPVIQPLYTMPVDSLLQHCEDYAMLKSLLASGDFCRLLIIFANSLDPDQDKQNIGPYVDPNCLTI